MDRDLFVYVDLAGEPHLVGRLWTRQKGARESATFEYDDAWLANPARFALEPALTLGAGPQHTVAGRRLFGAIGDSAPDRWGRVLILRDEQRKAREEQRRPRTLTEADYLLGVGDTARPGALRFAEQEGGPFLADDRERQIPPLVRLGALLNAAQRVAADGGNDDDIRLLLAPGSSLGGARPKASVIDRNGALAIAKFPRRDDDTNVILWESLTLQMARDAGIRTAASRLERVQDKDVLILPRFDRNGEERLPFLSAMSMLDAVDNEERSYLEIADSLRRYGAKPEEDCIEVWRRIVFTVLVSNTDDHLRNHGFLYDLEGGGWRVAPAYDLNPTPVEVKPRILCTAINEADATASLEIAFEVIRNFGLKLADAKQIASEVGAVVSTWRARAVAMGIANREIDGMASAFEHNDLALSLEASG